MYEIYLFNLNTVIDARFLRNKKYFVFRHSVQFCEICSVGLHAGGTEKRAFKFRKNQLTNN